MTDLIFHHFAGSPFSEKVRIAFGIKQLAWKSVTIPNMMPKPDLMPLTGGYRKTPVLQVGADIYCDTQLIMLEIERRRVGNSGRLRREVVRPLHALRGHGGRWLCRLRFTELNVTTRRAFTRRAPSHWRRRIATRRR